MATQQKIGLTDTVLLSVPAGSRFAVTTIPCNIIIKVPDTGGSQMIVLSDLHSDLLDKVMLILTQSQILNDLVVAGADTFTFDTEKIVLEGGDRIIAVSQFR